jgi:glycosyltransferase involved in cell wall biosynthesis
MLITAFATVRAARPDAQLLLVGGTPTQVAGAAATVARLGLTDSVCLTGRVSKSNAMRYTGLAHVLVSPRLHGTNTPLKVYEQLASGKPLVATRIWSHTQVLNDTVCICCAPSTIRSIHVRSPAGRRRCTSANTRARTTNARSGGS